jgi:hypothetical protein
MREPLIALRSGLSMEATPSSHDVDAVPLARPEVAGLGSQVKKAALGRQRSSISFHTSQLVITTGDFSPSGGTCGPPLGR